LILAVTLALANDAFTLVKTTDTCTYRKREKTPTAGAAMFARCTWPDVAPAVLVRMFDDLSRYDEWIWPIAASRVERREGERDLVYQRQEIWALSDREVLLWVTREQTGDDTLTVRWTTANEVPLDLTDGAIRTPRNIGYWTLKPAPDGGSIAEHQIEVDAGGGLPLPKWLVRAIQTRGFTRVMDDVHDAAVDQAKAKSE
jgi:hypothetical protein